GQRLDTSEGQQYAWPAPAAFLDIGSVAQFSNGWARCTGVALCNSDGQPRDVFEQGDTARFFCEFEILRDIEVPSGGVEIQNDKGIVVHGKSTLEYGSDVPVRVVQGSRLRFRQDMALEIAVGEYTFNVGMGMLPARAYEHRAVYAHAELDF